MCRPVTGSQKKTAIKAPKGVPDYVPPTSASFVAVRDAITTAARRAGYGHIELPVFEDTTLFARGVGSRRMSSPRRCTRSPIAGAGA